MLRLLIVVVVVIVRIWLLIRIISDRLLITLRLLLLSVSWFLVVCNWCLCLSHLNRLDISIVLNLLRWKRNYWLLLFATTYEVSIAELFFFLNRRNWLLLIILLLVRVVVVVILRLVVVTLIVVCGWLPIVVNWLNWLLHGRLSIVVDRLNWLLVGVIVVCVLIVSLVILLVVVIVVLLLIVSLIVLVVVIVIVLLLNRGRFNSSTYKVGVAHSIVLHNWLTHLNGRLLLSAVEIV